MKATDLKVGEHYRVAYGEWRSELISKGQGHGNVHTVRHLNPVTSQPLLDSEGNERTQACSSRDIIETTAAALMNSPQYLTNWQKNHDDRIARQQEHVDRETTMQFLRDVCEETAGLLTALGFEAKVTEARYNPQGNDFPYIITIANPTEHQDLLRRMVAEKWGIAPAGQGSPVTDSQYPTETTTEPEDQ